MSDTNRFAGLAALAGDCENARLILPDSFFHLLMASPKVDSTVRTLMESPVRVEAEAHTLKHLAPHHLTLRHNLHFHNAHLSRVAPMTSNSVQMMRVMGR